VTETAPPVSPSPPPTVAIEPRDTEVHSVELFPLERPIAPQPFADQAATREELLDRCNDLLGGAVEIARHLPPRLLVHLNSERLVEVALGSCITTGLNSEVFLATAGAVLSWAHDLPLSLDTLLATYGTDVGYALREVHSTLELLSGLDQPRRSSGPRR
jgi:hypothetical protein